MDRVIFTDEEKEKLIKSAASKLTDDEYNVLIDNKWNSGYDDGRKSAVTTVIAILSGKASRRFLKKEDDLANYTRDLISEIEGIKK